jgi:2-polyprenyl-6-methoxyphenol hydroxylase-like FAD-dependent oxidoreductase
VTGYDCDVLVVGAGPVGQVTALLLAERGLRVIVLERWDQPYPLPRAVALAHDVLRVLHSLGLGARLAGLLDPWGQEGHEFLLESADGEPLAEAHYSLDSLSGFPEMSGFSQPDLELVLEDRVVRHFPRRHRIDESARRRPAAPDHAMTFIVGRPTSSRATPSRGTADRPPSPARR